MMNRSLNAILAAASLLAVAGCNSDGVTTTRSETVGGYSEGLYVQSAAQNGTNVLAVRNSPFAPEAVLEAVRARYQGNQYRFALGAAPDWNGYTVIIGFGRPPVGAQNLCQNPNLPQPASSPGVTELTADYCYGNRLVSETTGRVAAVSDANDPRFRALVGQSVAELFTNNAPHYPHGGGVFTQH
jgi:hypothetical protein